MVRGSPNPRHFGLPTRLRKARKQARLTRRALEQQAGGTNGAVLYIETNQRLPTVATIVRLASALEVSAGWLAYGLGDIMADGHGLAATADGMAGRLHSVRTERALTKAALARLVELSPSTVADIENGAQTGVEVLESLASALGISPAWLAFGTGPRELPKKRRRDTESPTPTHA